MSDELRLVASQKTGWPPWSGPFLAALRMTGNVSEACRQARTFTAYAYTLRKNNPEFAAAWADAMDEAVDSLEKEAWRRAREGVSEPIMYQGEPCGVWVNRAGQRVEQGTPGAMFMPLMTHRYSDTLLIFLLKGNRPEKYRDNVRVVQAGDPAAPVAHAHSVDVKGSVDVNATHRLDPAALAAFAADLAAAGLDDVPGYGHEQPVDSVPPAS